MNGSVTGIRVSCFAFVVAVAVAATLWPARPPHSPGNSLDCPVAFDGAIGCRYGPDGKLTGVHYPGGWVTAE